MIAAITTPRMPTMVPMTMPTMETMPAVEFHQQPGSVVMLQLVGLVAAGDVFVGVAGEEEIVAVNVAVMAEGAVTAPGGLAEKNKKYLGAR